MKPFLKLYSEYSKNEIESFLKSLESVKTLKDPTFNYFLFEEEIRVDSSEDVKSPSGELFTPHEHFEARWVYGMLSGKDIVVNTFSYKDSEHQSFKKGYTIMHCKECTSIIMEKQPDDSFKFKIQTWDDRKKCYKYSPVIDDWFIHAIADYKKEFLDE